MSILFSSVKIGQKRKYGEAKQAWGANETCRKGCGRRPNGRPYKSWKVHEAVCKGTPPKYDLVNNP